MSESAPLPALPMPRGVRHASMISASAIVVSPNLARRHADRAVKPHVLAIEVAVGDHGVGELGVFLGPTEPAREGYLRGQRLLQMLRCALQERRIEDARQDGVGADAFAGEVARDDEVEANDAGFGSSVGGLADLAVFGGDRGGV